MRQSLVVLSLIVGVSACGGTPPDPTPPAHDAWGGGATGGGGGAAGSGGVADTGGSGGVSSGAGGSASGGAAGSVDGSGGGAGDGGAAADGGAAGSSGASGGAGGSSGGAGGTGGVGGSSGGAGGSAGTGGAGGSSGGAGGSAGTGGVGGSSGGAGGSAGTGGVGGSSGGAGGSAGTGGVGGSSGGAGGTGGVGGSTGVGGSSGGGTTIASACSPAAPQGAVYYVATNGSDASGNGSSQSPWATIGAAVGRVADGSTILVRPGDYTGVVKINGSFATGITIRSEQPYQARLRNSATVVQCFYGSGITVEGFDIAHSGPGAGAIVVQIQDVDGNGGCSRITLRNNILHDSYNNDILKINNGATQVLVEYNVFYNQGDSDEHMDVNSVEDVTIQHNIFFNDFEGSGRTDTHGSSSFVVVKDSNQSDDRFLGAKHIDIRGNVFLHYQGSSGAPYVLLGEDGMDYYEAQDVLIENNLLLGNNSDTLRASFGCKGVSGVTFRNNTVSGDLTSSAFAMRLNTEGANLPNHDIRFFNNIWSDPTGTMSVFSTTPAGETESFQLVRNLYWNDGNSLPISSSNLVNISDDPQAVKSDPALTVPAGITLPRWNPSSSAFADGSATVCEAFSSLVDRFATPAAGSAAIDAADAANASPTDIYDRPRGSSPDLGALER